jgi:hypothetical protein
MNSPKHGLDLILIPGSSKKIIGGVGILCILLHAVGRIQHTYKIAYLRKIYKHETSGGKYFSTHLHLHVQPPSPTLHPLHELRRTLPLKHSPV